MNLTLKEKMACLFTIQALADCDGRKNREEIEMITRCSHVLGVKDEEIGIIFDSCFMTLDEVVAIIKPMDKMKKVLLEECMKKIMEADGPANEKEIGTWWGIQMQLDLPTWISRKNDE